MGSVGHFLKEPAAARFLAGGLAEAEALLGSPIPVLPAPEHEEHRGDVYFVNFHPRLRTLMQRYVAGLLAEIGIQLQARPEPQREPGAYEAALRRILLSVRASDRRLGLTNLFWLAHSRDVACYLREVEAKTPAVRKGKYSLHPLLSTFYRRVDKISREDASRRGTRTWLDFNPGLVDAVIDDGFAFTELTIGDFDFVQFLASNKRYRLLPEHFLEIHGILLRETERRLREGERGLLARVARHMPGLPREHYLKPSGMIKIAMNAFVQAYLLGDAWNTGTKLLASPVLQAEVERRKPAEIVDAYLDLVTGVKRFELTSYVRDRIRLLLAGDGELDDKASRGLRVYEFGESAHVLNHAVNATVLFLDLRGFTKTSEGQISERDLARELYTVFDAFVPYIRQFGGKVDKFLGDGIMVTFGTDHADALDPLNALRAAILCQDTLQRLRREGQTYFKMGIAVHFGRAYLAHFIADESTVQATIIGRNVNLAGRLSSAAKKPMEEDEVEEKAAPAVSPSGLRVTVDETGVLFNEGIALSRDALLQLETHLPLTYGDGVMEFQDEVIGRLIQIRYAGDAKFKGVRSSLPVYAVEFEVV
jgi:class 3 adenylate cyclase